MKSRRLLFVLLFAWLPGALGQYKAAMPGYRYEFPRDHFNHPEFQTEWWYTNRKFDCCGRASIWI